jgi:hypothetical protein
MKQENIIELANYREPSLPENKTDQPVDELSNAILSLIQQLRNNEPQTQMG